MTIRERDIEKAVTDHAKKKGWLSFKWTSPAQRFVPDRLYFKDSKVIMIEFKRPGGKPTKGQRVMHKMLERAGFTVHVIDGTGAGKSLFLEENNE